jgi:SAM-dependent methyltransferase
MVDSVIFLPDPARELTRALEGVPPGNALDVACGSGRNAVWLARRGWRVTAVDRTIDPGLGQIHGVNWVRADLEKREFAIGSSWDLIVCWLYWQPDLLDAFACGLRAGGLIALAGKTTGRFATSLERYRAAFADWREISSGENEGRAFFIAQKPAADNQ